MKHNDAYDAVVSAMCASKIIVGQGEMKVTEFGAKRESNEGRGRFDLLPYEAIEALAKWYEAGATKYEDRNWEKGISVKDCINRMIRHALKAGNGWTDEDHLAAVMWNAAAAITMMQRKPECNDHPWGGVVHNIKYGTMKCDDVSDDTTERSMFLTKNFNIKCTDDVKSKTCTGCYHDKKSGCISSTCGYDKDGYRTNYVVSTPDRDGSNR